MDLANVYLLHLDLTFPLKWRPKAMYHNLPFFHVTYLHNNIVKQVRLRMHDWPKANKPKKEKRCQVTAVLLYKAPLHFTAKASSGGLESSPCSKVTQLASIAEQGLEPGSPRSSPALKLLHQADFHIAIRGGGQGSVTELACRRCWI